MTDADLASLEARWREKADKLSQIIDEMRTIAMVAGQCSVEGHEDSMALMAAAEAERCGRWADDLAALRIATHEVHETTNGKIGEALGLSGNIICVPKDDDARQRATDVRGATGSPRSPQPRGSEAEARREA